MIIEWIDHVNSKKFNDVSLFAPCSIRKGVALALLGIAAGENSDSSQSPI